MIAEDHFLVELVDTKVSSSHVLPPTQEIHLQMLVSPQTVRRSIHASEHVLQQYYTASLCRYHLRRRYISNGVTAETRNRAQEVKDVAILGGGITGLVSAFYLSKQRPDIRITIFEGSSRLGGWLHSKQVDVGSGNVVFEQGPRTLRPNFPNGLITLKLVCYDHHVGLWCIFTHFYRSRTLESTIS